MKFIDITVLLIAAVFLALFIYRFVGGKERRCDCDECTDCHNENCTEDE